MSTAKGFQTSSPFVYMIAKSLSGYEIATHQTDTQIVQYSDIAPPMHRCHARPSLPVVPDHILTPPNLYPTGLHHTAAEL